MYTVTLPFWANAEVLSAALLENRFSSGNNKNDE